MLKKNKIKVLRVGNLPSNLNPGQGEAAHQLFRSRLFQTVMFSTSIPYKNYSYEIKVCGNSLYYLSFPNKVFPKNINIFKKLFLSFQRVMNVFRVSINILKNKFVYSQDIIHIHHIFFAIPAISLKLLGKKIVITIHGSDIYKIKNSFLLRLILRFFDQVLVVSLAQKELLKEFFNPSKIKHIGNAVEYSFYNQNINYENREKIIINIGSLRWQKNQILLLKAFNDIHKLFPNWKLVILGEGNERANLENYIFSNNLECCVSLEGSVDKKILRDWLNKSRIFVMCSLTEGLPKALLEACASGCACISTNVGDCSNFLNDIGLVSINNDKNDIYHNIVKLILDLELAKSFSQRSTNRAKSYSWNSYLNLHKEIYNDLLK
tara:strand:- start:10361 stop:11494 length:1134 start_codon:yes stop_codon:yes gene_type:complete